VIGNVIGTENILKRILATLIVGMIVRKEFLESAVKR